jgi:D-alanyl-D-alanine carboxypeptidase/D-alanyl-D-alanine-endopeptidase (penicillin-binding protein 4)
VPPRTALLAVLASAALVSGLPPADAAPAPALVPSGAPTPAASLNAASLRQQVDAALLASGATVVGAAVDIDGVPLLRRRSTSALPPASTQKSFVALASLRRRGVASRSVTEVARTGSVSRSGTLSGSLFLVAGGDPTLSRGGLLQLARQVRAAGITTVGGSLWLDDSRYDRKVTAPGWKPEWLGVESGPLSALAVDRNGYRRDAAFLRDPAIHNALLFRTYLAQAGVRVVGGVARGARPGTAARVTTRVGSALADVAQHVLQVSDNFVAELMLKELGRNVRGRGTSADGLAAVKTYLPGVALGVAADGSGLSVFDRQAPGGQLQLLRLAQGLAVFPAFVRALPVACREGTLLRRLCGTAASGRAVAKTGSLDETRALAGYTRTADGRFVSFAFQLQGLPSGPRATDAIDRAVALLSAAR